MGDTSIERSGENCHMTPDNGRPSIEVVATVESIERTSTRERPGKKRKHHKKAKPFGFAQALPKTNKR